MMGTGRCGAVVPRGAVAWWLVAGALVIPLAAACDPCAGVLGCATAPRLSDSGRVVEYPSGAGAPGVTVTVAVAGRDTMVGTDRDGFWQVELANPEGDALEPTARITVRAPQARTGYTVDAVPLRVTTRRGDGVDVGRWLAVPQLRFTGELRPQRGLSMDGATVEVDRLEDASGGASPLRATVSADNRFYVEAPATAVRAERVRLRVTGPRLPRTFVQENVVVRSTYLDTPPPVQGSYFVGTALPYALRIERRGLRTPWGGVSVTFRRTGGVTVATDSLQSVSTADGLISLRLEPLTPGTVVGDLEIRPPAPFAPEVVRNVRLVTVDDDVLRSAGAVAVGPWLPYAVRLYRRGTDSAMAGVRGVFRRRGGVATATDTLASVSTREGLLSLQLAPLATGELVGDLELVPPAPLAPLTVRTLRLDAVLSDSLRLAANVGVGAQVRHSVRLFERSSLRPLPPDVEVEFLPDSGPLPASTRGRTGADGVAGITGPATAAGEVVGDLLVRWGAPRAPERRRLRLRAVEDDSVRFAGSYGVGPSLLYLGMVRDAGTNAVVTAGVAEFRRTGGIPVRESVFTWAITTDGLFRIAPTPLEDGEVEGTLTLRLPAPYADTTFTRVRLTTFTTDDTRPGPTFFVRPR